MLEQLRDAFVERSRAVQAELLAEEAAEAKLSRHQAEATAATITAAKAAKLKHAAPSAVAPTPAAAAAAAPISARRLPLAGGAGRGTGRAGLDWAQIEPTGLLRPAVPVRRTAVPWLQRSCHAPKSIPSAPQLHPSSCLYVGRRAPS